MYEHCLNEAERQLAVDKDVIVAVKKLWADVVQAGQSQGFEVPAFADFSAMLEGDPRFEFLPFHHSVTEDLEDPAREDHSPDELEMEHMGFFSGDRVKLRRVALGPQVLGNIIRSKVDNTMTALTKAWRLRPDGDRETEDRLMDILSRTQKLQKEVQKTFSRERMARLERTLAASNKGGKGKKRRKSRTVPKKSVKPKSRVLKKSSSAKSKKGR